MHRPATEMCWKGEKHPKKTGAAVPRRGWWRRWQAERGNSHTPVRGCNWDQCAPPAPLQPPVVNPLGFKEKCPYRPYKSSTRGVQAPFAPSAPASLHACVLLQLHHPHHASPKTCMGTAAPSWGGQAAGDRGREGKSLGRKREKLSCVTEPQPPRLIEPSGPAPPADGNGRD